MADDKSPTGLISAFADTYTSALTIWEKISADVVSLAALGLCIFFSDFSLPSGFDIVGGLETLKKQLSFLDSDIAKDFSLLTIASFVLAFGLIILQGGLTFLGGFTYPVLQALFPYVVENRSSELPRNYQALGYIAAGQPPDKRQPERIWSLYAELANKGSLVRLCLEEEKGNSSLWASGSYQIARNASVFLAFFWVPGLITHRYPALLGSGSSFILFFSLLVFFLIAHARTDREYRRRRYFRFQDIDAKMEQLDEWKQAIALTRGDPDTYMKVAFDAFAWADSQTKPSLLRHFMPFLRPAGPATRNRPRPLQSRQRKTVWKRTADLHRQIRDLGYQFRFQEQQPRYHENHGQPRWLAGYAAWTYVRLCDRLRGFGQGLWHHITF